MIFWTAPSNRYAPPAQPSHFCITILKLCVLLILLPLLLMVLSLVMTLVVLFICTGIPIVFECIRSRQHYGQKPRGKRYQYIDVGGYSLCCVFSDAIVNGDNEEANKKPVIIFFSGLGMAITPIFDYLQQEFKNYRFVAIDRANYGTKENAYNAPFRLILLIIL